MPSTAPSSAPDSGSPTWFTDFFSELPNEFWRRAVPPEATDQEVDFIERHLALAPGSRILDVPCGSGRHSLALAARGHRVSGLDISAGAVGHARRAATSADLDVELAVADMRRVPRAAPSTRRSAWATASATSTSAGPGSSWRRWPAPCAPAAAS